MSVQDTPDWQTESLPIGSRVLGLRSHVSLASESFGPFFVSAWEGIQLHLVTIAGSWAGKVAAVYWFDAAATIEAGRMEWSSRNGTEVIDTNPNYGPYMTVVVTTLAGHTGEPYDLDVMVRRHTPQRPSMAWEGVLDDLTVTLAAGMDNTLGNFQYGTGRALLAVLTDATDWTFRMEATNAAGGVLALLHYTDDTKDGFGFSTFVTLPGLIPQYVLHNGDAVDRVFRVCLTMQL